MSWCVLAFVGVWVCRCALSLACRVYIARKQIKKLVQTLFAMPAPPPPGSVLCGNVTPGAVVSGSVMPGDVVSRSVVGGA